MKIVKKIVVLLPIIFFSSCKADTSEIASWYKDVERLWADYYSAVKDAETLGALDIYDNLPVITVPGENDRIDWYTDDGTGMVLVASMMEYKNLSLWPEGKSFFYQEGDLPWVTIPYELYDRVKSFLCTDSLENRMRMLQLLGLPPDCEYDTFVFFYVDKSKLFRPSKDPEIDDNAASLEFSSDVSEHYREWFLENEQFSYRSETPYPWTRLGYTYDWHSAAPKKGIGEFVVHRKAKIKVDHVCSAWALYKKLKHLK